VLRRLTPAPTQALAVRATDLAGGGDWRKFRAPQPLDPAAGLPRPRDGARARRPAPGERRALAIAVNAEVVPACER
jgi:hypothetical protein